MVARAQGETDSPRGTVQSYWTRCLGGLGIGAVAVLCVLPPPTALTAEVLRPGVLTVFAIACWATGVLPEHVTALAFFCLAMLFSVASAEVVFSGFLSASLWLVFSGLVLAVAIVRTGLGTWVAQTVMGRFGTSFVRLVSGLVLVGMTLTFVMPSTIGRTLLLIPLVVALAERLGFAAGTQAGRGSSWLRRWAHTCRRRPSYRPTSRIWPLLVPQKPSMASPSTMAAISSGTCR